MTDRTSGLPDEILLSIVTQIQGEVPDLSNPGNCFMALNPEKTPGAATGGFFCIVSPRSGTFPDGFMDGGGQAQCTVNTGFVTRIYSMTQVDPAKQDGLFLTDATRGIFQVATKVLQALALFDPVIGDVFVVRDQIMPDHFVIGRNDRNLGYIEIGFKLTFDWDLS